MAVTKSRYASPNHFDAIIIGAGIAGPALAYALSTLPQTSENALRIALMDRSFAEPNRIVGELLQPGGMKALRELGMQDCVNNIDAIPCHGYAVLYQGKTVHIPYPNKEEGRSFHHGRFVQNLRAKARTGKGVECIEATVSDLIESPEGRVLGVRATRKAEKEQAQAAEEFFADVTFVADGWSSKFRSKVLGASFREPRLKSHFIGLVLKDVRLPIPKHGTVALIPGTGPVLIYQIGEHETRMLVDAQGGLPKDIPAYVKTKIIPHLPENLHDAILDSVASERPKSMPNSFFPSTKQGGKYHKPGAILLGDSWNMRHPLTGGGMTVAFSDVVIIRRLLDAVVNDPTLAIPDTEDPSDAEKPPKGPFSDWSKLVPVLTDLHWERKGLASTVNILSVALYDLFGAEDENLFVLREGCFKYFERGGKCVDEPVSLLAAIAPSPMLLAYHFFSVAFYAIYCLFAHPRPRRISPDSEKMAMVVPGIDEYPLLAWRSVMALYTAAVVFLPLVWTEVRWW
ncbi:Squalene epoxidase [Tulasnella sp. UAMH 9824]|nr:Squalene epoxidase [Tulasnella sp. UAMH 9824]